MPEAASALPRGYALYEYRIDSVLGAGGFGLTYLATDSNLNLKVALKEYLPGEFAVRGEDSTVQPKSGNATDSFQWGLQRFMDEARTLASFRHPNIVRVMRFFEANQTGYMVMEFVEGKPLSDWILARRPVSQATLLAMAGPLLDGLEVIHRSGYLHRDIKPANIFIRGDGTPVLLDFGSARQLTGGKQELTAVVSPGYAPLEQYHAHGKQGPWSDIYSFGGVLYWMLTGNKPVEAAARVRQDILAPAAQAADVLVYSAEFLAAVDWALKPNEDERPQSIAEFRRALLGGGRTEKIARTVPLDAANAPTVVAPQASSGMTGLTGVALDREQVKRIEAELARHLGPVAAVVVGRAVKKASTISGLVQSVSAEIGDEKARATFVRRFSMSDTPSRPTGQPASAPKDPTTGPEKFSAETLRQAETELAQYIGAMAKVIVKRAAAKARYESELYRLIAEEIKDPAERSIFIRKATSVSGRR